MIPNGVSHGACGPPLLFWVLKAIQRSIPRESGPLPAYEIIPRWKFGFWKIWNAQSKSEQEGRQRGDRCTHTHRERERERMREGGERCTKANPTLRVHAEGTRSRRCTTVVSPPTADKCVWHPRYQATSSGIVWSLVNLSAVGGAVVCGMWYGRGVHGVHGVSSTWGSSWSVGLKGQIGHTIEFKHQSVPRQHAHMVRADSGIFHDACVVAYQ